VPNTTTESCTEAASWDIISSLAGSAPAAGAPVNPQEDDRGKGQTRHSNAPADGKADV